MSIRRVAARVRAHLRSASEPAAPATPSQFIRSLDDDDRALVEQAMNYSMIGPERLMANIDAARYIVRREIPGDFVECGVWRGGSVLVMIRTLQQLGVHDRDFYLFDTFEGMSKPTDVDTSRFSESAMATWDKAGASGDKPWEWAFEPGTSDLASVQSLLEQTGYPPEHIHCVQGRVEDTVPAEAPAQISLLRLDTDWYESTKHELVHLYPRLRAGGVLIVDDYGHWDGCRRAVDEYFAESSPAVLLTRVDYSCRLAIKP